MSTDTKKPPQKKVKQAKQALLASLIRDRAELETKLGQITRATILFDALTAEMNASLKAIEDQFRPQLNELAQTIKETESAIEIFVREHREELFLKGAKTIIISGHELSLTDNGGAVATVKGITQDTALQRLLLHENEELADQFVSWRATLAKSVIQAQFDRHEAFLSEIGLRIEHTENFKLSLNLAAGADVNLVAA